MLSSEEPSELEPDLLVGGVRVGVRGFGAAGRTVRVDVRAVDLPDRVGGTLRVLEPDGMTDAAELLAGLAAVFCVADRVADVAVCDDAVVALADFST